MEEDDCFIDLCFFFKKVLLSHFSFEKGTFSNWDIVLMYLYFDSLMNTKNQNLLNPVLIIEKFMKVEVLTKGHYTCGVL